MSRPLQASPAPTLNKIIVTEFDRRRLIGLVDLLRERSAQDLANVDALENELERADVVRPDQVPADVVTMNSRVQLRDLDTNEELSVTLAFPGSAEAKEGRISVLAPIGLALLGCSAQQELTWPTPSRVRRLRIERILYQPEAAGHFDL